MVFVTTLIISLMVSLMFFQDPTKEGVPGCTEVCNQQVEGGPVACETVCVEPPKAGIWVSVVSALITTPIVFGLTYLFTWLRKPIIKAVEPKRKGLGEVAKNWMAAKKGIHVAQAGKPNKMPHHDVADFTHELEDELKMMDEVTDPEAAQMLVDAKKDGLEVAEVLRPRHAKMSALPFCYGLTFGFGGLFMIYGVAANLGPDATLVWLVASVTALAMKVFLADPLKVAFAAVLMQVG
jgi:hypothetical protein